MRASDYNVTDIPLNEPRLLTDGILVTGGDETRNHAATWVVLITINPPTEQPGLRQKLRRFRTVIQNLNYFHGVDNATLETWDIRITDIENTMFSTGPIDQRTRRGILNIVGELSRSLFGTATDTDVAECRRQIELLKTRDRRVVHSVSKMLSVINQTHNAVVQNRKHINSLQDYVEKVSLEVRHMANLWQKQDNLLQIVAAKLRVEQLLAAMEARHDHWLQQVARFNRQKASLELGFLTEELLSRRELTNILTSAKSSGFHAPKLQWYYAHMRISSIFRSEQQLLFRVKLPLTDNINYNRYHITTWPVPHPSRKFNAQIQVTTDIALHTLTGGIFRPNSCQGRNPMICRAGAVYDRTRFKCPRGILTGEPELRKTCRVKLTKVLDAETQVIELIPGTFIILSVGETVSLFCSSSPESRLELPAGASALRLNRGCRVTAQGWSISSIARFSSTVMVDFAVINIPPMKLLNLIPHETLLTQLASPVWDSLGEINDVQLDALPLNDNDVLTWGSYSGHVSWTVALLVIVLSAGLIYILFVLYRHHLIKPCFVFAVDGRC